MKVSAKASCRILNVCGNEPEHLLLARALEAEPGLILERCETGIAALDELRLRDTPHLPDVLVTPWRLPMLSVCEFIIQMKADQRLAAIAIVVFADISQDETARLRQLGAARVLRRGITLDSFEAATGALLSFCRCIRDN